nr:NADH dehydrogenase subunit 6 [Stenochironomus sp. 1CZ]
MKYLMIILQISSMSFIFLSHPVSMNMNLMMQTLLISIFSGLFLSSFWFSYSLFLIFLGGMLILFLYMTAIASNEKFSMKMNLKFPLIIVLMSNFFVMIFLFIKNPLMFFNKMFNLEVEKFKDSSMINFFNSNYPLLNKIYNFPMNLLSLSFMMYLFLTLIATVKISTSNKTPMRKKN